MQVSVETACADRGARQTAGQRLRLPGGAKRAADQCPHVRSAIARFGEVGGVSEGERTQAFANVKAAAHDLVG